MATKNINEQINAGPTPQRSAGMLFIRLLLGIIFFMQGYGKVFSMGVSQVYDRFFKTFETTMLPKWLIVLTAYYTSYAELIAGLFLIVGLFRKQALYILALDLLVVSFGHGYMEPIWDLSHVIPRALLLIALFLLPPSWDSWHVDTLINKHRT
jgi:putative oxidoreductase